MSKKGKVLITLLIIIIVALSSAIYCLYNDNVNKESTINDYKTNLNQLQNQVSTSNSNASTDTNILANVVGTWTYSDKITDPECDIYIKLVLNNDGTYTYSNTASCCGGRSIKGNYSIGKDKIYLYDDSCEAVPVPASDDTCQYPNCSIINSLGYTNGKITVSTCGGTIDNLVLKHEGN